MRNPLIAYYSQQAQTGNALNVFKGERYQRGSGIGSILRGLLPLLKKTGTNLLASGIAGVASDIASGSKVKDALKQRGIAAAKQLATDTCDQINQSGKGLFMRNNIGMTKTVRRKKRRSPSTKSLIDALVDKPVKRRRVVRRKKQAKPKRRRNTKK